MDSARKVLEQVNEVLFKKVTVSQWQIGLVTAVVIPLAWSVYDATYKHFNMPKEIESDCPTKSDTAWSKVVNCYVFPGSAKVISTSPFTTKFITYLRLAGIPHNLIISDPQVAPKGKSPYIEHDGKIVSDSELTIRYLENTFNVEDMSKEAAKHLKFSSSRTVFVPFAKLSASEQAISDLVRLACEGELYWALVSTRWLGAYGLSRTEQNWTNTVNLYFNAIPAAMRSLITEMIRVKVYNNARGQGLTRHSAADQIYLAGKALRAVSAVLGDKKYLLGDDKLCEGDCALFGVMQCILDDSHWVCPLVEEVVKRDCPNLIAYEQRMRAAVYFDEADKLPNMLPKNFNPVKPLPAAAAAAAK